MTMCGNCHFLKKNFSEFTTLKVYFPSEYAEGRTRLRKITLMDMLKDAFNSMGNTMEDYLCAACDKRGDGNQMRAVTYMPDYLILDFARFQALPDGDFGKILSRIEFGESINLDSIFIPVDGSQSRSGDTAAERGHVGPFVYDVYAVIMHIGTQIRSGHYYAMARNLDKPSHPSSSWHVYNDTRVAEAEFEECQTRRKNRDATVTNLFLKRRQRA